jgi:hypothetical protein
MLPLGLECAKCRAPLNAAERACPACGTDAGAPNVRIADSADEVSSLKRRFDEARTAAAKSGNQGAFDAFAQAILDHSSIVVCLPASIARSLAEDTRQIYANYEALVGAGIRSSAGFADDSHRRLVAGALFGSFGDRIRYGVLSLTCEGISTYGEIYCRLKPITVDARVSFLEENSFRFHDKYCTKQPYMGPPGYRCDWSRRHWLAAAKLGSFVKPGDGISEWQRLLVKSDGVDRKNDEFIEAHLYDGFNLFAIEAMEVSGVGRLTREQRNDQKIALAAYKKHVTARPL